MLKIKLLKANGKRWSAGEHGGIRCIQQHRLILAAENQSPPCICETCRQHTNATALPPTRFDDTLLFSSLAPTIPLCFCARFAHVYAHPPRHARLSGGSRSRFIHSQ